jgi:hypothetical protein
VWRLATFLVMPPTGNPVCAFFFSYLFYLVATALERDWGTFRYVTTCFLVRGQPFCRSGRKM